MNRGHSRVVRCLLTSALLQLTIAGTVNAQGQIDAAGLSLFMGAWQQARTPGGEWDGITGDMDYDGNLDHADAQAFLSLVLQGSEVLSLLEAQQAAALAAKVDPLVDQATLDDYGAGATPDHMDATFVAVAPGLLQLTGVAEVQVEGDFLIITHHNGLQSAYIYTPPHPDTPVAGSAIGTAGIVNTAAEVGAKTALFLHVLANDTRFAYDSPHLTSMQDSLKTAGFADADIVRIDGDNCTLDTFKQFADKGFVLVNTHGAAWTKGATDNAVWVTGDRVEMDKELVPGSEYVAEWKAGRIFPTASCVPGDHNTYWCVTQSFFSHHYNATDLPGSLVYNAACSGLANDALSDVLLSKGAACYMGWTDSQSQSIITGGKLLGHMKLGATVSESMALLSDADKHETRFGDAYLQFRPDPAASGTSLLADTTAPHPLSLSITTPSGTQSGDVTVEFRVSAPAGQTATFEVFWQHRGALAPLTATIKSASAGTVEQVGPFFRIRNVPAGSHSFVWASGTNVANKRYTTCEIGMRYIEPEPSTVAWTEMSDPFTVDNKGGSGLAVEIADVKQVFTDWQIAFNNKREDMMLTCLSEGFFHLGLDRDSGIAKIMEELGEDPSLYVSLDVGSIQVDGDTAIADFTGTLFSNSGSSSWEEPSEFEVLGFSKLVKVGGIWYFHGNQLPYLAQVKSVCLGTSGLAGRRYSAELLVQDPTDRVKSASVTGPGITGDLALKWEKNALFRGWRATVDFGTSAPATPADYRFGLTLDGASDTVTAQLTGFFTDAATGMTVLGPPYTFVWTSSTKATSYRLEVYKDAALTTPLASAGPAQAPIIMYPGAPPLPGTYYWIAIMQDADANTSMTVKSWTVP